MKTVRPHADNKRGGQEFPKDMGTHQGRACPCPKGSSPKAAMIDGPFGGKKPE